MTILATICAGLAAVVLLGPAPGVVRLRSILSERSGSTAGLGLGRDLVTGRNARLPAGGPTDGAGPARAPADPRRAGRPPVAVSSRGRTLAAAAAGASVFWLIEGALGMVVGAGLAAAAWYGLGRLEPAARRRDRERLVATLPLAADLMSAALAAGCPPAFAAETVGAAIGGPLGRALVDAAAAASVGVEPGRAWSDLDSDPGVRPLTRALTAAMTRGTSPSPVLARVSADARDAARWAGEARARSLGARAAAPLGLCFLPAFILVGVVPIVATSGILIP